MHIDLRRPSLLSSCLKRNDLIILLVVRVFSLQCRGGGIARIHESYQRNLEMVLGGQIVFQSLLSASSLEMASNGTFHRANATVIFK